MHTKSRDGIDALNALLRGELAATETYQQAMEKMTASPVNEQLRRIRDEHRTAANEFRKHIHDHGGQPDQGSGVWGTWSKFVEGAAKIFGERAALEALRSGEEQGAGAYMDVLESNDLPEDCKAIIRPIQMQTNEHVSTLNHLMQNKS
jgi:uncharacterized protein (TIGR02284 family)